MYFNDKSHYWFYSCQGTYILPDWKVRLFFMKISLLVIPLYDAIEENDSDLIPSKAIFIFPQKTAASSTFAVLSEILTKDIN